MTKRARKLVARERQAPYRSTGTPALRVNARLDPETAAALDRLVEQSGETVTDVLKTAIHRLHLERADARKTIVEAFGDLVGCLDGPPDLSTNKAYVSERLDRKHGHR